MRAQSALAAAADLHTARIKKLDTRKKCTSEAFGLRAHVWSGQTLLAVDLNGEKIRRPFKHCECHRFQQPMQSLYTRRSYVLALEISVNCAMTEQA